METARLRAQVQQLLQGGPAPSCSEQRLGREPGRLQQQLLQAPLGDETAQLHAQVQQLLQARAERHSAQHSEQRLGQERAVAEARLETSRLQAQVQQLLQAGAPPSLEQHITHDSERRLDKDSAAADMSLESRLHAQVQQLLQAGQAGHSTERHSPRDRCAVPAQPLGAPGLWRSAPEPKTTAWPRPDAELAGECPRLTVKNTFLDVASTAGASEHHRRERSVPPRNQWLALWLEHVAAAMAPQ